MKMKRQVFSPVNSCDLKRLITAAFTALYVTIHVRSVKRIRLDVDPEPGRCCEDDDVSIC